MGSNGPSAKKVVCIDFDATIVPWGPLYGPVEPFPGVAESITRLKSLGYRVIILTSRLSETWAKKELASENKWEVARFLGVQHSYVANVLDSAGVPYDDITAEKVPADVYFDDRAWGVMEEAGWGLSRAIPRFIEQQQREGVV